MICGYALIDKLKSVGVELGCVYSGNDEYEKSAHMKKYLKLALEDIDNLPHLYKEDSHIYTKTIGDIIRNIIFSSMSDNIVYKATHYKLKAINSPVVEINCSGDKIVLVEEYADDLKHSLNKIIDYEDKMSHTIPLYQSSIHTIEKLLLLNNTSKVECMKLII